VHGELPRFEKEPLLESLNVPKGILKTKHISSAVERKNIENNFLNLIKCAMCKSAEQYLLCVVCTPKVNDESQQRVIAVLLKQR
jgi:hypothetical protein